jgi:hypothetical protein
MPFKLTWGVRIVKGGEYIQARKIWVPSASVYSPTTSPKLLMTCARVRLLTLFGLTMNG